MSIKKYRNLSVFLDALPIDAGFRPDPRYADISNSAINKLELLIICETIAQNSKIPYLLETVVAAL
jgi:hypothetical protein